MKYKKIIVCLSIVSFSLWAQINSFTEGVELAQKGQWKEASKLLEETVAKDPRNTKAHYWLGRCYQAQVRFDEALDEFGKVILLDAKAAPSYLGMGEVHFERGNLDGARISLEKAIDLDQKLSKASNSANLPVLFSLPLFTRHC